jgi:hypothetical protein
MLFRLVKLWSRPLVLMSLSALWGCPFPSERIDAGTPALFEDAGLAAMPRRELALAVRAVLVDGGITSLELQSGARPMVDPLHRLEIRVEPTLANVRIRLFDEGDRVVESNDESDPDQLDRLDYQLTFPAPLKSGRRYQLMLDAQTGDGMVDRAGFSHPDQRLEFVISGDKQPAPRSHPPRKKRHRR